MDGKPYTFEKRAGDWCPHACASGCAVHSQGPPARPRACQVFQCMWLHGFFEDRHRPDRARVVPTLNVKTGPDGKPIWYTTLYESWPGTAQDGPGREVLDALREGTAWPVLVLHRARADRTIYYPGQPGRLVPFTGDPDAPGG